MALRRREMAPQQPPAPATSEKPKVNSRMTVIGGKPLNVGIDLKGSILSKTGADGSEELGLGARFKAKLRALGLFIRGSGEFKYYQANGPETVTADFRTSGEPGLVDHIGGHVSVGLRSHAEMTVGHKKTAGGDNSHAFHGTIDVKAGAYAYGHSLKVGSGAKGSIVTPDVTVTYET